MPPIFSEIWNHINQNPWTAIAFTIFLLVLGVRLTTALGNWLLLCAWLIFVVMVVYRAGPLANQPFVARLSWTAAIGAVLWIGVYYAAWKHIPAGHIDFMAATSGGDYALGTTVAGIRWVPEFTELRLVIGNHTPHDFRDVDLTAKPDAPIVAAGQRTSLPGVLVAANVDLQQAIGLEVLKVRRADNAVVERQNLPAVCIATERGYRVRIETIPSKSQIELTFAAASIAEKHAVTQSHKDGTKVWIGDSRWGRALYRLPKPIPRVVKIKGRFTIGEFQREVAAEVQVRDVVQEVASRH